MHAWLASHGDIFMAQKEAHYFNTDHKNRPITCVGDYQALFHGAGDEHLIVGETSVRYLYSKEAVANICNYNPAARFVVLLRNPIELAPSWHNQIANSAHNTNENVGNFAQAWRLQTSRKQGRDIPENCKEVAMTYYGDVCKLGEQLQRVYSLVAKDRVHIIFYEDLAANPRKIYLGVLDFLQIADDGKSEFSHANKAKNNRFINKTDHELSVLLGKIKRKIGIRRGFGIAGFLLRKNAEGRKPLPLSAKMHQTLADYFAEDIALLASLTKRDLSHWR